MDTRSSSPWSLDLLPHTALVLVPVLVIRSAACDAPPEPHGSENAIDELDPRPTIEPPSAKQANGLGGPSHFHSGVFRPDCGNGTIEPPEQCDNGRNNSNSDDSYGSCTLGCTINVGCGDHEVQPGYELCDKGPMGDEDCTDQCIYDGIHVFLTEEAYTSAQLGGLLGADQRCQTAAASAGLPNHLLYKAWLSTSKNEDDLVETAFDRLQHHNKRYVRLDGVPVAMNWNDLIDSALLAPINVTNTVSTLSDVYVWSNTNTEGLLDSMLDCGNWADGIGGRVGNSGSKQDAWTAVGETHACIVPHHLYCFEQLPEEN